MRSILSKSRLSGMAVAALLTCLTGAAEAAPVSYTFTQTNWTTGSLSGSFSGSPESNGVINLKDLTSFSATFSDPTHTPPSSFPDQLSNLLAFSFDTTNPIQSLEFAAGLAPNSIIVCSGAAEVSSACGYNPPAPSPSTGAALATAQGYFVDLPLFGPFTTISPAVVSPAATATPEPGTASLLSCVAGGLILAGGCRRRFFHNKLHRKSQEVA